MFYYVRKWWSQHRESWLFTFAADLIVDFALGVASAIIKAAETGDMSQAAIAGIITSAASATLRQFLRGAQEKIDEARLSKGDNRK